MVLRFYGYDESGNIVYPIKGGLDSLTNTSDPAAVVEKFIPFIISKVNWTIGTKTVSYDFEAAPVGQNIGGGSSRGTIPYDVQLVDSTVGGVLGGVAKYSSGTATGTSAEAGAGRGNANDPRRTNAPNQTDAETARLLRQAGNAAAPTPTPPKADAAPSTKKTITEGLMGAMNDFQQELVQRGTYLIADEYSIEFVGIPDLASASDISGAKIQLPNTKKDKKQAPNGQPINKNPSGLNQATLAVDYENRNFSITAGQQILQVIEMVIRNSSYIGKQKLVIVDPDGKQELNQQTTKNVTWFTISMSCERKGFDDNRNDYAYKIKYTVSPFLVKNLDSQYFPATKFTGVHKSYPFWFTGKNTAVKDYQETLNTMFVSTLSGSGPGTSITAELRKKYTSSMSDLVKYVYSPRSDQSNFGAEGKELEPNANAAEILYNPSDLANTKVRIIGDPAWIMQGSQFKPLTASTVYPAARTGFEADGSISFDSQDILFEMLWQRPEDYDLNTGLADPYVKQTGPDKKPLQSRVYVATKVTSEFKGGSFEQTLDGSLYLFPLPSGKNTANPAAPKSKPDVARNNPDQTDAETARLLRQAGLARKEPPKTSVTGATPTSATAQGQQQLLNPPKVYGEPSLTQLERSQAYIEARRNGQTAPAALQAARDSFATGAGGSPVTSNGSAVATRTGASPNRLPNGAANANNPSSVTNAGNQPINKTDN